MRRPHALFSKRPRARWRYVLVAASAFFWAGRAEAVTVALLRPATDASTRNEALFRLQGELLALGATVRILDDPMVAKADAASEALQNRLERAAEEQGIDAFIAVVGDDTTLEADVWIREASSPRLRLSRVTLEPAVDHRTKALAIRAIEVLRSSFLALDLASKQRPAARPEPPARVAGGAQPARDPVHRLGLEAGATAITSFGKLGPGVMPLLRVEWALGRWSSLQGTAAGLGTRPRVESAAGKVAVARDFALLGLCLCLSDRSSIRPFFALSAGALHTALEASPRAPNLGHRAERWAALVDAAVGARLGLAGPLYLTVAGHVQFAAPYVAIHVLDSTVATTGRPNVLLTLTAGARP